MESGKNQFKAQMRAYLSVFGASVSGTFLDGLFDENFGEPKPKLPGTDLGHGLRLLPIELTEEEQKNKHIVNSEYSHLYKDGIKVSDDIYRKGGMGGYFSDGYCELLWYQREKKSKKSSDVFSSSLHVLINLQGKIVLKTTSICDYPYHVGGIVCNIGSKYYNLENGKMFFECSSQSGLKSSSSYFLEKDKKVYQILLKTAQVIIHV